MDIYTLIAEIPENTSDEALLAVQSVTVFPAEAKARLRVHLAEEFRMFVSLADGQVSLEVPGWKNVIRCAPDSFLGKLRFVIHEVDADIAGGLYTPPKVEANLIFDPPPPPSDMDIPIWDERTGRYYDAEH